MQIHFSDGSISLLPTDDQNWDLWSNDQLECAPHNQSNNDTNDLNTPFYLQVCLWSKYTVVSQPTIDEKAACFACLLRIANTCWNIGNFNAAKEIIDGLR